ncbi:MAG: FeoB-associated Cys-rich membrane protein [Clostridia bacterium]|nr:FeoB-associated Cys-rich membrane protein [Clostridia bacterium]
MIDIIIILAVLLIVGGAGFYVWRAKKSGQKCIGCPHAGKAGCSCGRK